MLRKPGSALQQKMLEECTQAAQGRHAAFRGSHSIYAGRLVEPSEPGREVWSQSRHPQPCCLLLVLCCSQEMLNEGPLRDMPGFCCERQLYVTDSRCRAGSICVYSVWLTFKEMDSSASLQGGCRVLAGCIYHLSSTVQCTGLSTSWAAWNSVAAEVDALAQGCCCRQRCQSSMPASIAALDSSNSSGSSGASSGEVQQTAWLW